jgi:predicted PurR-regulated permease PerM
MSASAAIQGVVGVIGYLIAGVPQPVFFGLLTFVAAFVPLVGTALVSVPLAAALFLLGRTGAAIFLLVWSIVALGLVDNVVKPMLLKGAMRIHGAMVFFSLVGGLLLFGPVGVVAGPLSVTFLLTMIRVGQRDFAGRGPADPDPAPPQP